MEMKHEESYPPEYQRQVRYQFESFCRKVIHSERCDYLRQFLRRTERETNFSALPEASLNRMACAEDWSMGPYTFYVHNYSVPIEDEHLIDALLEFNDMERSILLLSYSISLTDKAVGELLNISHSRVSRYKAKLLKELRKKMEE